MDKLTICLALGLGLFSAFAWYERGQALAELETLKLELAANNEQAALRSELAAVNMAQNVHLMELKSLALISACKLLCLSSVLTLLLLTGCCSTQVQRVMTCPTLPELPAALRTAPQPNHLEQAVSFIKHNRQS